MNGKLLEWQLYIDKSKKDLNDKYNNNSNNSNNSNNNNNSNKNLYTFKSDLNDSIKKLEIILININKK